MWAVVIGDERSAQSFPATRLGQDDTMSHSIDDIRYVDSWEVERVGKLVAFWYRFAKGERRITRLDLGAVGPDGIAIASEDLGEVRVPMPNILAIRPGVLLVEQYRTVSPS